MSNKNSPVQIAKSIRSAILNVRYKIEYRLSTNYAYAWHRLKGGTTRSRLLKHQECNWHTSQPPSLSNPDRHAIFVAYHPGREAPQSNINYLQSLVNCGFQVTYIHNGPIDATQRAPVEKFCTQVICRENIGQDFGAWKDWLLDGLLQHRLQDIEWLLLCNDSNFFLATNAQAFEKEFSAALSDDTIDLIALNKNLEISPHYQSYFICYHRRLFLQKDFSRFWRHYKPISNRHHAIIKGEIQLTAQITGFAKAKILYNWPDLYIQLSHITPKRSEFYSLLPKGCMYLSRHCSDHSLADEAINKIELHKAFMVLELHNPSHALALLFARYCSSPFLKKDIVKHGCYSIAQITELLTSINIERNSKAWLEIIDHYILTGNNASYINRPKEAYQQGVPVRGQQFRGHGELMTDLGLTLDA